MSVMTIEATDCSSSSGTPKDGGSDGTNVAGDSGAGKAGSSGGAGEGSTAGAQGTGGTAGGGGAGATGGAAGKSAGSAGAAGGDAGKGGGSAGGTGGAMDGGVNPLLEWAEWPMPNGPVDVDAGAPNLENYTDNGDGTVTDNVTKLMWQQAVPSTKYIWSAVLAYCPTLTLGGRLDWRIPTAIELLSLVDYSVGDDSIVPTIDATMFPATPLEPFWASTSRVGSPTNGWGVDFGAGRVVTEAMASALHIRCVR
jgi:hypothetical protein